MDHQCHVEGCHKSVPPEKLMCYRHWKMVPKAVQIKVYKFYRAGQCDDKSPSSEWLQAAREAIECVKFKEMK